MRQIFTPSGTSFPLLRGSRVAAGVDHPRRKQDKDLDKDGTTYKEVQNVMDNTECRDVHPYVMVI